MKHFIICLSILMGLCKPLLAQNGNAGYDLVLPAEEYWTMKDIKYILTKRNIFIQDLEIVREFDPNRKQFVYKEKQTPRYPNTFSDPDFEIDQFYLTKKNLYLKLNLTQGSYEPDSIPFVQKRETVLWFVIKDLGMGHRIEDSEAIEIIEEAGPNLESKIRNEGVVMEKADLLAFFFERQPEGKTEKLYWNHFSLIPSDSKEEPKASFGCSIIVPSGIGKDRQISFGLLYLFEEHELMIY